MPNEFRLRLPEKSPRAARLATMFANQASVPKEVYPFKILSINRVHVRSFLFICFVLQ